MKCQDNNINPDYAERIGRPDLININQCPGKMKIIKRDGNYITRKCDYCRRISTGVEIK